MPAVEALLADAGLPLDGAADAFANGVVAEDLYLLTETAAGWFERLGYRDLPREAVPEPVRQSVEFTTACAENAIAMVKPLQAPGRR